MNSNINKNLIQANTLKVLIVEDEINASESLKTRLVGFGFSPADVDISDNIESACANLLQVDYDLIFLDIQLGKQNGISLLNVKPDVGSKTIITSAYNNYASDAYKHKVSDYLLKPFSETQLCSAIIETINKENPKLNQSNFVNDKLAVPAISGFVFLNQNDVVRISADRNYSNIHLRDGKLIVSSKNLGYFESKEFLSNFLRVHKSHIVNLNYVSELEIKASCSLIMIDDERIPVSTNKRHALEVLLGIDKSS
ncbi:MAG: response regulator transcription factor [Flavobacteriales bacterium]|nr:response regulator transcription factor [Flavobacteriales bacterium]